MAIIFIIIFMAIGHANISYNGIDYPDVGDYVGWAMVAVAVIWIPAFMIYEVVKEASKNGFWGSIIRASQPAEGWGPAVEKHRQEREAVGSMSIRYQSNPNYDSHNSNAFTDISKPAYVSNGVVDPVTEKSNGYNNANFEIEHDEQMWIDNI